MQLVGLLYTHYSKVVKEELEKQKQLNLKFLNLLDECQAEEKI